jgi:hypothetical protein
MALPQQPEPVKLFVAVLWANAAARDEACARMTNHWGAIDYGGGDHLFDVSDYYEPEMGASLQRRFIAFERLVGPEILIEAKLTCNQIEEALAEAQGRRVNLDVGYLDHNKIVLASAKGAGQKIYLGQGIYADLVARYARGRYQPFEWSFLDFKSGRYDAEFAALRGRYLQQLREARKRS